jgi:hypothetical protein
MNVQDEMVLTDDERAEFARLLPPGSAPFRCHGSCRTASC